jgi:thiol-disulfide isomerase/thioredoxin
MSLGALALSALVTSRYRQVHARISSGSIGTSRFAPSGPVFPAVGTPVPEFSAITTAGARIGTDAVSQQGSAAVFLHTQCQVCKDLLPEISGFLAELAAAGPSPLAVISGEREQIRDYLAALPAAALTVSDPDGELADSFDIHTFPTVLVFDDGKVSASGSKPAELLAAAR